MTQLHATTAPSSTPTRLRVLPHFGGALDVADWRRRHAAGQVPDAVPYGLDRLAGHGYELLAPSTGWHTSRAGRLVRGAARRTGGGFDWALGLTPPPAADAVLSWDERGGVPLALRHGRRLPVVTGAIWTTDAPPATPALHRAVSAGLQRAARVVVLSAAQVPVLVRRFGVREERVAVVPFGVDADFFTPGTAPRDPDLVVAVGNDRDRDWPTALAALAHARRHRPSTRLVVVSRTAGTAVAAQEGVEVLGHLGHRALHGLLTTASAALVTTRPNLHASGVTALLEALATGVAVVASGTPGMADYAPAGGGVTLVAPGDAAAAGDALLALLCDPDRALAEGAAGRRAVEARSSTERQAGHLARVLTEAAA